MQGLWHTISKVEQQAYQGSHELKSDVSRVQVCCVKLTKFLLGLHGPY